MPGPAVSSEHVLADAGTLLQRRWRRPVQLSVVERMRPAVWRAEVGALPRPGHDTVSSGLPSTVIVRVGPHRVDEPLAPGIAWDAAFANELAGSRFLDSLPALTDAVPDVLGYDVEAQVLITEDLGRGPSLASLLMSGDPNRATAALVAHAQLLGRIAAITIDRTEDYRALRATSGPAGSASMLDELQSDELRSVLPRWTDELQVSIPAGLDAELAAIDRESRDPGEWAAYTPADACPDNNVVIDGRIRIFDLGFGGIRHLALDAAYGLLPFPTCWCYAPLPTAVSGQMQTAFRGEVAQVLAAAEDDDVWAQKLAWACATWFVGFVAGVITRELDREQDRGPLPARHAVVAQLHAVTRAVERHHPAVAELAHDLEARLRRRWGVASVAGYPALRTQEHGTSLTWQ